MRVTCTADRANFDVREVEEKEKRRKIEAVHAGVRACGAPAKRTPRELERSPPAGSENDLA